MRKLTKLQLACTAVLAIFCASYASAFSTSMYTTKSRLATGKWVKITISENGIYELTYDELSAMGFSNPARVHVYGYGGNRISELLNGTVPDDLKQVPILRQNNKICFYGNGPLSYTLESPTTIPHFLRDFNPYSVVGCYFLSENDDTDLTPTKKSTVSVSNYVNTPTSLGFFHHEKEQVSITNSGKQMIGEDFTDGTLRIDYYLPGLCDSTIVLNTCIAANASDVTYANAIMHSGGIADTTVYTVSNSRIYKPANDYIKYNYAAPYAQMKLSSPAERGQFQPYLKLINENTTFSVQRLDYFIITYRHTNVIPQDYDNQLFMAYGKTTGSERFQLPNASSSTVVWYINDTKKPQLVTTSTYNDATGSGLCYFTTAANSSMYVAFDPTKELKKIDSYEDVENQDLHGMSVPNMLIITNKNFMEQAQRIADLHAAIDGITVAVVDHEKVFNEFSSGTRDGMAYRLLCKMLYDRNSSKFKNLLLFGTGSFDNRELLGKHPDVLLTYQSDNSNYEDYTYTTDDFFAFLGDNSGASVASDRISIGVGRITCDNIEEAKSDVDKLVEYYANPDYGVWRNNTFVMSDAPDGGLFMFQGQGYVNQIDNKLNTGMHVNTVHNSQYPRSPLEPTVAEAKKTASEAKDRLRFLFKDGAYFATYVGHAGATTFTKTSKMWTNADVARTPYPHWPIMSTACCDVAHYDEDSRGIAELMFHKRDGGAIALLTASRMVYASNNDKLNTFFINGLFSYDATGVMPTLGEAYMKCKHGFNVADINKLSFFLLGDPAIRVNYPISLFNITSVNGTNLIDSTSMAQISPLSQFEIKAQVLKQDGTVDTGFNGDATVTLYDSKARFTTLTFTVNGISESRDIYFDRPKLAEISGRVVNGQFTGTMVAPRAVLAKDETVLLRTYAHKDNSNSMVNGMTEQITMLPFDESAAISDTQAPVITSMYINDETTFGDGAVISPDAMLYINVTDDIGINLQANAVDNSMKLVLDGGKQSYNAITCFATTQDGNKVVNIEFPLTNLLEGMHTLTYTVYDMCGNSATRTISFLVGQTTSMNMVADKMPAFLDDVVNFDVDADITRMPEVVVRVTDATGKLMWMTKTNNFPVTWDMKDMNGNKVPAGLYRYFGTFNDGINYGGTPINNMIVLDALKVAKEQ